MVKQSGLARRIIYIGAEDILSSLRTSATENYRNALNGISGLAKHSDKDYFTNKPVGLLKEFKPLEGFTKVESMCIKSARNSLSYINKESFSDQWLIIISTTKGDIEYLEKNKIDKAKPTYLAQRVKDNLPLNSEVMVVSNACISGLLATITAHDYIYTGKYKHALVIGVDAVSEFITCGFESFYALSEKPSSPFDKNRIGLSLGEAASCVVLSPKTDIFKEQPMIFVGGVSSNDANHISGPSRTGEGLVRAIDLVFKSTNVEQSQIDFISAHGTGTKYNDDMESVAFARCNLQNVPTNSMKGYFGHTLGAAGVLELAMSIQSMRYDEMLGTLGCTNPGTSKEINVLLNNKKEKLKTVLKTASGFGGCNAAVVIKNNSD